MLASAYRIHLDFVSGCWIINTPLPEPKNKDWQEPLWLGAKDTVKFAHQKVGLNSDLNFKCGYRYKSKINGWFAPEGAYKSVQYILDYANKNGIVVLISDAASLKLKSLVEYEERGKLSHIDIEAQPIKGLKSMPDDGQYTAIKFIESAGGRALIGSEPGWGKSLVALGYCEMVEKKAIIFCPSQRGKTKFNWSHEVSKHTDRTAYIMYGTQELDIPKLVSSHYVIINYDIVGYEHIQNILKQLIRLGGFRVAVFDESHKLKNHKTCRYKDVEPFIRLFEDIILLSATAIENKVTELYPQLHMVAPDRFNNRNEFKVKYCGSVMRNTFTGEWHGRRQTKQQLKQLHEDIKGIYFYRKLKNTVDLEKKIIAINHAPAKMITGHKGRQKEKLIRMMVPYTVDTVNKLLESSKVMDKIIVYTGRIEVAEMLKEAFGDKACITHGGNLFYPMSEDEAREQFSEFNKNPDKKIMVATYQSFAESINLHHLSNFIVFNDLADTPSKVKQAWGRVVRRGQKVKCYAYFMSFPGTYYDEMIGRVEIKAKVVNIVLTNRDPHGSYLREIETKLGFKKLE